MSAVKSFFPGFYLSTYPDVAANENFASSLGAADHFRLHGKTEGRLPNPLFVARYYLAKYEDLRKNLGAENYAGALNHWMSNGINEGRQGSPLFDPAFYLSSHNDLVLTFGPNNYEAACNHWLSNGYAESRRTIPSVGPLFEPQVTGIQLTEEAIAVLRPKLIEAFMPMPGLLLRTAIVQGTVWLLDKLHDLPSKGESKVEPPDMLTGYEIPIPGKPFVGDADVKPGVKQA